MPEAPPNPRPEGPRPPGPPTSRGTILDLRASAPLTRWECPACARPTLRLPTGRMRDHGGHYCPFPAAEALDLATPEGLDRLTRAHPQFRAVYDAVRHALVNRPHPRPHGGQLRHPDPRDPSWRWGR